MEMSMARRIGLLVVVVIIAAVGFVALIDWREKSPEPGTVTDEARHAGRTADSFPASDSDYFHDVDGKIALTPEQIKGRNTWLVWTGGDDRFWDGISKNAFGSFDLLKIISSHPSLKYSRSTRWDYFGLINEPCFTKADGPDPKRFGLWLDQRSSDCPPDPFAEGKRYPGVAIGARGKNMPVGSYYGEPTGVVGLRLFPNPEFDETAAKKWDAKRYYEDPGYYLSKDLVRPYRVGMSCGFCHVGPNPLKPPADPENPKWGNISTLVGAQYFWIDRIFEWAADEQNYIFQLVHTARPGTVDTSLVSTDNINNPRTMNAVYNLLDRLNETKTFDAKEMLSGGERNNKQFNDFVQSGPLTGFYQAPDTVWTPHVLKDGSDSVGALGALNRVYVNIGLFSEEWLLHFNPLVGGKPISPIEIAVMEKNSAYWQATEQQTMNMALFLAAASAPHHLLDAPGGANYLTEDAATVARGKAVFAETCARCHSSKGPPRPEGANPAACAGPGYLECWNRYWAWTKTDAFKAQMRDIVNAPDFLDHNFLSTDLRVPVTLLQTNACSPLATNALAHNIWDNFSSSSYKSLPSVGEITYYDPATGEPHQYKMPAGGRGYTRPPSLISLWSTAPFLLNNSVGPFGPSPSVEARMQVFQASIEQILWPERRAKDAVLGDKIPGVIDRTTATSSLTIPSGYQPPFLSAAFGGFLHQWFPAIFDGDDIRIGPIPKGTPVDLLANLQLLPEDGDPAAHWLKIIALATDLIHDLKALPPNPSDADAAKVFANLVPRFMELSKCPDFIVNRGHYFGTDKGDQPPGLSDADKTALIAFLKTF
jgi:mono/diheme cytochrome c family protein